MKEDKSTTDDTLHTMTSSQWSSKKSRNVSPNLTLNLIPFPSIAALPFQGDSFHPQRSPTIQPYLNTSKRSMATVAKPINFDVQSMLKREDTLAYQENVVDNAEKDHRSNVEELESLLKEQYEDVLSVKSENGEEEDEDDKQRDEQDEYSWYYRSRTIAWYREGKKETKWELKGQKEKLTEMRKSFKEKAGPRINGITLIYLFNDLL